MDTDLLGRAAQPAGRPLERRRRRIGRHVLLVHTTGAVERAFRRLAARGRFQLTAVRPGQKLPALGRGSPPEAIVVEAPEATPRARGLARRLQRRFPGAPILAYGSPRRAKLPSGFALRFGVLPSAEQLEALVSAARQGERLERRRVRVSQKLREISKRLQILTHIVSTANSILEPKRVVALVMSQIQMLIPSEAWSILLVDEEKRELAFEMALGEKGENFTDTRLKLGEGIAGWVAESGKPVIVNDVSRDPRFQRRFDAQTLFQTRSILCAPLVSRGHTIGVVEIMNHVSGNGFSRRDLDLLLTLVEPAAIALENAILFERAQRLTITDDLTKLYNSRYLNIYLEREIKRARRQGSALALIFLDLDGFKGINDRHGHLCGSRALHEVGAILKRSVRDTDIVSRYGGDEFVIVLPDTDALCATGIAERIRRALKSHPFLGEFTLQVSLSASFGISAFPAHGSTPQDLIQKADQAMYSVKEAGKDGVRVAS